ncbi:toll-like receptor Tollo [Argopecten irradians]|uniref:toll-like receptor Tollo n=1 Tax=Argopecten irradians TaxID=31199 RepID=UPI00371CA0C3
MYKWVAFVVVAELLCLATCQIPLQIPSCTLMNIGRTLDMGRSTLYSTGPAMDTGRTVDTTHRIETVHRPANDNKSWQSSDININCLIKEGDSWDFSFISRWTSTYGTGPVHVTITCEPRGRVYLGRPLKARYLERLYINSCDVYGTITTDLSEETRKMNYTIGQLTIDNSFIVILASDIWNFYMDNAKNNREYYPCKFPPTLQSIILRNTTYRYKVDQYYSKSDYATLSEKIDDYNIKVPQCIYTDLVYLEFSKINDSIETDLYEQFLLKSRYPHLKVLNISRALLSRTPGKLFTHMWDVDFPELELIDLSHNRITDVDFAYAPRKGRRLLVNLSNNHLTILHKPSIQNLRSFYPGIVDLRGNQWVCNCSQQDFVQFLQEEEGAIVDHYVYLGEAKCSRPVSMLGQYVKDAKDLCSDKKQISQLILYICLPLLILCFFVLIILVRFRREIRVLVYTRFTSVNSCVFLPVPTSSKDIEKDFDAFVSYSSHDETWVFDLCKRLEESAHGFRLCLHHKHFVPGACISDNIIDSVERSRHTIMVLSPNFLKSEWCILEFRKAFHQSLMENERHLVVVMLEGFDESWLQSDMKHFLKTYTYLKASDFFFMDKLVYALSKHRENDSKKVHHIGTSVQEQQSSKALLSVVKTV